VFFQRIAIVGTLLALTAVAANAQASPSPAMGASPAPGVIPSGAKTAPAPLPPPPAAKPGYVGHLPIIDLAPEADWADPGATQGSTTTGLHGVVSGAFDISGTITEPIVSGLSASYDHIEGDFLNSTFARIAVPGVGYEEPGSLKRREEVERLDYSVGKTGLGIETGLEYNRFECCLPLEFHDGYLLLSYGTPGIKALHGTKFVVLEKGATAAHHFMPGDTTLDINKREYGNDNIVVAVVPFQPHLFATATYLNGAYDYFENEPFPYRFNVFLETANFVLSPQATFTVGFTNVTQQNQGSPFPAPNGIHFVNYYTALKLHFDLNKLLAPK
jgi:hypothetical protein